MVNNQSFHKLEQIEKQNGASHFFDLNVSAKVCRHPKYHVRSVFPLLTFIRDCDFFLPSSYTP